MVLFFRKKQNIYFISLFILFVFSLYKATLGIHGDELHTVAMGDMIASGNSFFKESWFYLQLSAVVNAPFIYIFKLITGGKEGLILYLRIISIFIQLIISIYFYITFRKDFKETYVMLGSVLFFIYVPDFRSMVYKVELMWFSLLLVCYLYNYIKTQKILYIILAGIAISFSTLCYPPSAISLIFSCCIIYSLLKNEQKNGRRFKSIIILISTCIACAMLFMSYILVTIGISNFIFFFPYLLSDENISGNLYTKLIHPLWKILAFSCISIFPVIFIYKTKLINDFIRKHRVPIISTLFFLAFLGQTIIEHKCITWHIITYPYALSLAMCMLLYSDEKNYISTATTRAYVVLETICISVIISMTIASNQGNISCTMGMIFSLILLVIWPDGDNSHNISEIVLREKRILNLVILITSLFAFLYPVYEYETTNFTIESQKQCSIFTNRSKVGYGPLKGLSLNYDIYAQYNNIYKIVENHVNENDKLCVIDNGIGSATLFYLCKNIEYATYSPQGGAAIGTSDKLTTYYKLNPGKAADIVIINEKYIKCTIDEFLSDSNIGKYLREKNYRISDCSDGFWIITK